MTCSACASAPCVALPLVGNIGLCAACYGTLRRTWLDAELALFRALFRGFRHTGRPAQTALNCARFLCLGRAASVELGREMNTSARLRHQLKKLARRLLALGGSL